MNLRIQIVINLQSMILKLQVWELYYLPVFWPPDESKFSCRERKGGGRRIEANSSLIEIFDFPP